MKVTIKYFAALREQAGCAEERLNLQDFLGDAFGDGAVTAQEIYNSLKEKYHFHLSFEQVKVAINEEFKSGETLIVANDTLVFLPPVAGG